MAFGSNKFNCIFSQSWIKENPRLNITYKNIYIKQYSSISYLGLILDKTMSGESVVLEVIKKTNIRIKISIQEKISSFSSSAVASPQHTESTTLSLRLLCMLSWPILVYYSIFITPKKRQKTFIFLTSFRGHRNGTLS